MTSRTTFTSLLVLLAGSTIASASCGGGTDTKVPPPPKTTTSTGVTSSSGDTTATTGGGGAGGTGGASSASSGSGTGGVSAATCTDMLANGNETDKDCGGPDCPPCKDKLKCNLDADCSSKKCDATKVCSVPACVDGVKNGTETDLDCGGTCPGCGPGLTCKEMKDCKGSSCLNNMCAPTCTDGVKNPGTPETDVDCGGGACPPCANNLACNVGADCASTICDPIQKVCVPASCTDGIKNGLESDIDCGGGNCAQCSAAQKCTKNLDCLSASCLGSKCACPAGMQPVPKKLGGGAYCIDRSEVTYAEYQTFYSANPSNLTLPAGCPGAGSYTPSASWPPSQTAEGLTAPVSDVDWCDAVAYCLYSGKHLCGKVDGGANVQADAADAGKSEWYNACSAQGASVYPYGSTYSVGTCNGSDSALPDAPANACSGCNLKAPYDFTMPMKLVCQGGVPNVWGMSGSLAEWEDSCDNANPPNCFVRGGSRCDGKNSLTCASTVSHPRTYKGCDVGFRCCF